MNAKDALSIIGAELNRVKTQDLKVIEIEKLENYLEGLSRDIAKYDELVIEKFKANHEERMQEWRQKHESKLAGWEARRQHRKNMFDSVILTGQGALKNSFLINGGASVAILAFIGHLASSQATQSKIASFAVPLGCFVTGIFFSGSASALTYFTQKSYAKRKVANGNNLNRIVILVSILSGLAFIGGAISAFSRFAHW